MTRMSRLSMICALAAAGTVSASLTASAQTSTTPSAAGVLTTSSTAPTMSRAATGAGAAAAKRKPTSASPDMINEAIQRTEARATKEATTSRPQQWGSEEPFTYNPAR